MRESSILAAVIAAIGSLPNARLFRQNVGLAWAGKSWRAPTDQTVQVNAGDVVIRNARPIKMGVPGMADTGGWRTIIVTPEMVGSKIAQVVQIETKTFQGRVKPEQANWLRVVKECGGISGIARSPEDARAIVEAAP